MHFVIKAFLAGFWLILVPTASGALFLRRKTTFSLEESFLAGYVFLFATAELLTVPLLFLDAPLHILVISYGVVTVLAAIAGLLRMKKQGFSKWFPAPGRLKSTSVFFWAALLLIAFQVFVVVRYAHLDADDALYVAASTTAVQEDSIFHINAYTGLPYLTLPRRYIFSPFPMFLAVISQLCGGLHAAITAHTVFPAVFIPASYVAMYQLGRKWLPKEKDAQGIFLFLCAVLCWFSAYSEYNAGNFQMVRIWQGKAILAAFMVPVILYFSLTIVMEERPEYSWLLYAMVNLGTCLLSSVGIIFAPIMMGIFVLMGAIRFKSLRRAAAGLACCLPSVILGISYILILVLRGRGIL
ncbi:MAG: DUF6077 domain-containing protein [Lachnospiraceae bacterium]|nr:DUF6077 domain-containing protein [Lachnospiraceae bacterium]